MSFGNPDLGYAAHVPGRMSALLTSKCQVSSSTSQNATCEAVTTRCSNFNYTCSNIMAATFDCSNGVSLTDIAQAVVQAEPAAVRGAMAAVSGANYQQTLSQSIESYCGNASTASQSISSGINCTNSDFVTVSALNAMDAQSACATLQVSQLIAAARMSIAQGQQPAKPPISNTTFIVIVVVGTLVLAGALVWVAGYSTT